jgi:CubicO group peptidase (beta-lactamase class C family)
MFKQFDLQIAREIGMQDYSPADGSWRYSARSWHPAYVFRMSTRDLARFGLLYLRSGRWKGAEIVPETWVLESTAWHSDVTRPDGTPMPGVGYGLMWWTEMQDRPDLPDLENPLGPGVFIASGTGPQLLLIAPDAALVFVYRTNTDTPRGYPATEMDARRLLDRILSAAHACN